MRVENDLARYNKYIVEPQKKLFSDYEAALKDSIKGNEKRV